MAKDPQKTGRKRNQPGVVIKLIPHFDSSTEAGHRKLIGQKIVTLMLSDLRKRGRPKKDCEDILDVA